MVQKNKRGQDLSIGTLILIVLGIIVLVLLILGFSLGWSNLWEKINIFGGGNSLGDAATACGLAVTSQNTFDYCQNFRAVKVDGKTEYVNCQDQRIEPSLSQKLSCGNAVDYKAQCLRVMKTGETADEITVNGRACSLEVIGCADIGGENVQENDNCVTGNTKVQISDDLYCCVQN